MESEVILNTNLSLKITVSCVCVGSNLDVCNINSGSNIAAERSNEWSQIFPIQHLKCWPSDLT